MKIYKNHISVPNSVESCLELIRGIAFGYDGETTVEGLKSLIDEMANLAKDGQKFLLENKIHQEFIHVDEDYIYADLEEIIDAAE